MKAMLPGFTPGDRHVEVRPFEVPMSDGVSLLGDLLLPDRVAPGAPTIVIRTPYGRNAILRLRLAMPLATHGFPVFIQSARGTAGSGGTFAPQVHEQSDGIETLRWVRRQPWFTGHLATAGESYLGYTQWAAAGKLAREETETAATAMSLSVTMPDFGAITWDHGAFSLRNALGWSSMMRKMDKPLGMFSGRFRDRRLEQGLDTVPLSHGDTVASGAPIDWYQDWVRHEDQREPFWADQSHTAAAADVTAAIIMVTGWYDIFLPWQMKSYEALAVKGRAPRLTIGPWQHTTPAGVATNVEETVEFFAETFLDAPSTRTAPVRLFLTGADEWVDSTTWPPAPQEAQELFLGARGTLDRTAPLETGGQSATPYTYDPADPTPSTGGPTLHGTGGPVDDQILEQRPDVVVFTGDPLAADQVVAGTPTATIWLRSDRPSVDVFVRLCEVHPDGRSMAISDGIRRVGSPGTAHTDPVRDAEGAWPIEVELWPMAHRFARGSRLRVQISSGAHPRYARNAGTGLPAADETELLVAHQEVLHEAGRESSIRLPLWHRA